MRNISSQKKLTPPQGLHHHTLHSRSRQHAYKPHIQCANPQSHAGSLFNVPLIRRLTVIYGAHGVFRVRNRKDGGLVSTLAFPYWGLISVGLLSAWFHATLNYHSQMGDDLSMFVAVGALLHQLLTFSATRARRWVVTVGLLGTIVPISVYHC